MHVLQLSPYQAFRDGVGPSPKDGSEPARPPSKSATDYRSSFAAANQVVTLTRVTNDRVIIIIIIIIIDIFRVA